MQNCQYQRFQASEIAGRSLTSLQGFNLKVATTDSSPLVLTKGSQAIVPPQPKVGRGSILRAAQTQVPLTVTFLICGSLLRAQKGQGSGQALSIVNTKDGPRKKPLWAKQQFCPGPRAHGPQADSGAGGVGGCIKQSHHFPLHSRKLWIIFRFPFA